MLNTIGLGGSALEAAETTAQIAKEGFSGLPLVILQALADEVSSMSITSDLSPAKTIREILDKDLFASAEGIASDRLDLSEAEFRRAQLADEVIGLISDITSLAETFEHLVLRIETVKAENHPPTEE